VLPSADVGDWRGDAPADGGAKEGGGGVGGSGARDACPAGERAAGGGESLGGGGAGGPPEPPIAPAASPVAAGDDGAGPATGLATGKAAAPAAACRAAASAAATSARAATFAWVQCGAGGARWRRSATAFACCMAIEMRCRPRIAMMGCGIPPRRAESANSVRSTALASGPAPPSASKTAGMKLRPAWMHRVSVPACARFVAAYPRTAEDGSTADAATRDGSSADVTATSMHAGLCSHQRGR
jgi:hypothetical protein